VIHYNYSPSQLEEKAEDLLRAFDPERIFRIKPIDVYEVIEKCLDVPYDWKYLTPDQSILGMTAFRDGSLRVWPKSYYTEGMRPYKIFVEKGTIIIDSTLTESDSRGPENFTVMHEVFHQVLHKRCFAHHNPDYTHVSTKAALNSLGSRKKPMSSLEICEYQANYCASAFLMPAELLTDQINHLHHNQLLSLSNPSDWKLIYQLAEEFSVSPTAMKYRLLKLGLAH